MRCLRRWGASERGSGTRLWPTRRLFEGRHLELAHQVAELRALVDQVAEEQRARLVALDASQQRLAAAQAELRTRLRRTQALTARVYEAQQRWPALLEAARAEPSYARAYEEPEPLVSVADLDVPLARHVVRRALASVLAQTHTRWEAIVVGDHCTDDTAERVAALRRRADQILEPGGA